VEICPDCELVHHLDCWEENEGCAVYGCGIELANPTALTEPSSEDESTAPHREIMRGDVVVGILCLVAVVVLVAGLLHLT
jgi:hypothetical protein